MVTWPHSLGCVSHASGHVCVCAHVCRGECGGQRPMLSTSITLFFILCSLSFISRQALLLAWNPLLWQDWPAGWRAPWIFCLFSPSTRISGVIPLMGFVGCCFNMGTGNQNSGPRGKDLNEGASPQPQLSWCFERVSLCNVVSPQTHGPSDSASHVLGL